MTFVSEGVVKAPIAGKFPPTPTFPSSMLHSLLRFLRLAIAAGALLGGTSARAAVVINEIMYRPGTAVPENTAREYIELLNTDAAAVDLSGWAFTDGVTFSFPAGTVIPAGGFVVVAANPAQVQAQFGITGVLGPWEAGDTLSNRGEKITLSMPDPAPGAPVGQMVTVSDVHYASEGEWAMRVRETQFGGWAWSTPANGGGKSVELRNAALSNDNGQNWAPSTATPGGTPKAPNSVVTANLPPIVLDVKHEPAVPRPTDPVTISCRLNDEAAAAGLSATLFWRNATTTTPGGFQAVAMIGDGAGGFSATLAPLPDLSVVEFYVSGSDGVNTRTWPAPTSQGQVANCQYQVTSEVFNPAEVYYLLVLTGAENAAFAAVDPNLDREFNMTLISVRGSDTDVRYRSSMRIRGNSSRSYMFKPLRISIPNDDRLDGVTDFAFHPRASFLQFIGMRIFQAAGVRSSDTIPVELRRNGVESTTSSGSTPDYGKWVRIEEEAGDFIDNHWPEANEGNLYKKVDIAGVTNRYWRAGGAPPSDPEGHIDGWYKQNNSAANDWSDLTTFFQVWQAAASPHFPGAPANDVSQGNGSRLSGTGAWNGTPFSNAELASLETVSDLDQWARWFAVMTIMQDLETNISNGVDDDYFGYLAPNDAGHRRMNLLAHDLDTIFGRGDSPQSPTYTGLYDMTEGGLSDYAFRTLLPLFGTSTMPGNAAFRAKYHNAIRELYGTVLNADTTGNPTPPFYAFLDNHLAGWVPTTVINSMKSFATARQNHLLAKIGSGPLVPPAATSVATVNSPHGPLMISEVLARNVAAVANGAAFPDFIEIHNAGAAPADVGGMTLTDDPAAPAKYVLPAGTTIPAGGFLVLYADADFTAPGLHTGFALDQDGDQLQLYSGGTLLDAVLFGPQAADLSVSRTGAALENWALTPPTPNAANAAPLALASVGGVRINELLTNPDYLVAFDFVELFNPAAQPVAVGGVSITDDPINYPDRHTLPPLSFIGAGEFLVLFPKGNGASAGNATELPFKFSALTTWAALIGANGTAIDQLDTNASSSDISRGRSPDGGATLVNFALPTHVPTPGSANTAPPAPILALLNQLRITELLYRPNNLEFLELQNIGGSALDISGVRFTAGLTYTFSAGTTLAPGAFIVICKDRAAFTARYGDSVPLAPGVFGGTLDNAGETIALQPPAPWNVNILRFAYDSDWFPETDADHSLIALDAAATEARDWDKKATWAPSPQPFGNPGAGAPPVITSALTAQASVDAPFTYQITSTHSPTSYSAAGLPPDLTLDSATGLISGTPTTLGTFDILISATNPAGTDTKTLALTVSDAGPHAGFAWSVIPSAQTAGTAFTVTLRATDDQGRTAPTFNGPVQVSAQREAGASSVVFTEFGTTTPTPDYFELQNVSGAAVNTTGWYVITNSSSGGVNAPLSVTWALPPSLATGEITGATDGTPAPTESPYGSDIDWPGTAPKGWAMLVDNTNSIRDFAAWGYTAAEIGSINFSRNGATFTAANQWSGAGAPVIPGGQSLFRGGSSDTNQAGDWALNATPDPRGTQNPGLTVPMSSRFLPLAAVPNGTVTLVNGMWTGSFTVRETAASAELQAFATGFPVARSNRFTLGAPTNNTPPVFTKGPDQTVPEDVPAQTIPGWATGIFPGASTENGTQTVSFLVTTDNPALFSAGPLVQPDGALKFTPIPNANGVANVTIQAKDTGGTANGGSDTSAPQTFTITILPVNDAPSITAGPNKAVAQNAGAQTFNGWATGISPGPADEASQVVSIEVSVGNPALFTSLPTVTPDGTLTFTPSPDAFGTSTVTVTAIDSGGVANGGTDRTSRTATITSRLVNNAPSFSPGPDVVVAPVLIPYLKSWATNMSAGPASERNQALAFSVSTDRPDLFKTLPTISPTGVLGFVARQAGGTANITVSLRDSGGTADGGRDMSAPVTFTIELTSAAVALGKYRGLVQPPFGTPSSHQRLGLIQLSVTKTGKFSGKLLLGGQSHKLRGEINDLGVAIFGRSPSRQVRRAGLPPLLLRFNAVVNDPGARGITGVLTDEFTTFAEFTAKPDAYSKGIPAPVSLVNPFTNKGSYTAVFPAQPEPNGGLSAAGYPPGDGWTTLKLTSRGTLKMRGQFSDGAKFSYSSALDATNAFPFYASLYGRKGSVAGKMFAQDDGAGVHLGADVLTWFRPPQATSLYGSGWPAGISLGFAGTPRNIVTERNALPIGSATLVLTGGNLAADGLTQGLQIGPGNRITAVLPGTELKLKPDGTWSGKFAHPATGKTSVSGVTLRDPFEGRGFFLGSSEGGHAEIRISLP